MADPSAMASGYETLAAHQRALADRLLRAEQGERLVLTARPGTGKSTAIGAALAELLHSARVTRFLIVVRSRPMANQWVNTLERFGVEHVRYLDARYFRSLQAAATRNENPLRAVRRLVVSGAFMRANESRSRMVLDAGWDLAVLDDLAVTSAESAAGRWLQRLWSSPLTGVAISVASVPAFSLKLPGEGIEWGVETVGTTIRLRQVRWAAYQPSVEEQAIERRLDAWRRQEGAAGDPRYRFVLLALLRLAKSSHFALEQAIRRRLTDVRGWQMRLLTAGAPEEEDETGLSAAAIGEGKLRELLSLVEVVETDSKWLRFQRLVRGVGAGSTTTAVVLSDFAATAGYVHSRLEADGFRSFLITAASTRAESDAAMSGAFEAPSVLVATDASVRGFRLPSVFTVIHYDFPASWQRLAHRAALLERVSLHDDGVAHYFLVDDPSYRRRLLGRYLSVMDGRVEPTLGEGEADWEL